METLESWSLTEGVPKDSVIIVCIKWCKDPGSGNGERKKKFFMCNTEDEFASAKLELLFGDPTWERETIKIRGTIPESWNVQELI